MGLRDWIIDSERVATVTPATFATLDTTIKRTVAVVATVTVASSEKTEKPAKPKLDASEIPDDSPNLDPPIRLTTPSGECQKEEESILSNGQLKSDSSKLSSPIRTIPPIGGKPLSPIALAWLQENRVALKAAGWTARELYRRNKSQGIACCSLWDRPFLKVYLHDNGVIEFECVIADRDVIQTARPMPQRPARALLA